MAQKILTWSDVEALMEHLFPQFFGSYDAILMIARGGIIPGGMIAERFSLARIFTATVSFPATNGGDSDRDGIFSFQKELGLRSMPQFHLFPTDELLRGRRVMVVNHVWNHGRAINAVAGRVQAAGGRPELCVLHYKPGKSLFPQLQPDYYAAVTDEYIVYPWEAVHRMEPYRPMPELQ